MKAKPDAIIRPEQARYLEKLHQQNTGILREMEEYAAEHRVPIADREVALFLEITVRAMGARRALEFGTAIGYSVIHLARGMGEEGMVVSIEPREEMIRLAGSFIDRAGLANRVRIERGKALEVLPRLTEEFDLLYLDAVKEEYGEYLERGLPLLRKGGVVVVDNALWGGQVAGEIRSEDQRSSTEALRRFNERFVNHEALRAIVLPFGDGIGYAVKMH